MRCQGTQSTGFSLIEVLITLVVLSAGLLALAALQLKTLKYNHSAMTQSLAATLAYDVLDRMRANREAALGGSYDIALAVRPSTGSSIAQQDIASWKLALAEQLPMGDGAIVVNGQRATVSVQWLEAWDKALDAESRGRHMTLEFRTEL